MIGQRHREKKAAVLDVWRRYSAFRGLTDDGVDPAFLELRAKALEDGKYVLAIVGETKAGKSTFINALLGERILPTDILQSSSAIVEIFKSEKKYVEVRYADGHVERVEDDLNTPDVDKAFEYLRRIGSIQDRFRKIPATLIDAYIVDGRIKPDSPLPIAELESASKLPLKGKEGLLEEYVRARTLDQIPVEITFGFPLKYAFDELRLVDSPGVNALGGVQDRTFAYLHNANAVLFVHSMDGSVENSAFREFITHVIPNRTKHALFLVLSKSGTKSKIEIDEKLGEARSLFSQEFDSERILHADSMFKIMSEEILRFATVGDLEAHYDERRVYYEQRYEQEPRQEWRDEAVTYTIKTNLLASAMKRIGNGADREFVRSELRRLSNFDVMERTIDEFSARAPELQLAELLAAVKRGYENQIIAHEQDIDFLEKKKKHPQTLENELNEIRRLLSMYKLSMHEFAEQMMAKYVGTNAKYRKKLEDLKSEHLQAVQAATDGNMVRKVLADFHDANSTFIDEVAREVRDEFKNELARLGDQFKSEHSINVPTVDIDGIEAKAKDASHQTTEVPRDPKDFWERARKFLSMGFWSPTGSEPVFDPGCFLHNFKSEAARGINGIVGEDYEFISHFLDNFIAEFKRALQSLIDGRQKAYEELLEQKATNDETLADIAAAENRKRRISEEVSHVSEMLEDLR
ncbi:MAG: dynamin family protein [Thiomonas arsenitoxydans]|uniref:Dynamin family protein n=1 Tax=Thiomonas arsenitoxydans (strain DSM 22701 / CIP 110005 / 3As) TaxID=426114 RepID=A0A8I1N056_THIA3|nr:dynamin family protein [Thiomonas arsenitoxydans]MBN8745468.1 dynamin family protein [Thiomonas arsenitoxydans]